MIETKFKAKVQVSPESYYIRSNITVFTSLSAQIDDIFYLIDHYKIKNPSILIIGVGNDLLKTILKYQFNYLVDTLDIDPDLKPDIAGSVHQLDKNLKRSYDIIVCCHVLEHMPFELFEPTVKLMKKYCRFAVIHLPIAKFGITTKIGLYPLFEKNIDILSTYFFKPHKFDGQHYWEIGTKGYSLSSISKTISSHFDILVQYNFKHWKYCYNFILGSRK